MNDSYIGFPDDSALSDEWMHQAMQEREQEVAECIKRVIAGTATLNDAFILAAECGVSDLVFPKALKTPQRTIYPIIEREEIE